MPHDEISQLKRCPNNLESFIDLSPLSGYNIHKNNVIPSEVICNDTSSMEDRETNRRFSKAIQLNLEKRKIMNKPIAVYDKDTGEVYAVHNDGKREVKKLNGKI